MMFPAPVCSLTGEGKTGPAAPAGLGQKKRLNHEHGSHAFMSLTPMAWSRVMVNINASPRNSDVGVTRVVKSEYLVVG